MRCDSIVARIVDSIDVDDYLSNVIKTVLVAAIL